MHLFCISDQSYLLVTCQRAIVCCSTLKSFVYVLFSALHRFKKITRFQWYDKVIREKARTYYSRSPLGETVRMHQRLWVVFFALLRIRGRYTYAKLCNWFFAVCMCHSLLTKWQQRYIAERRVKWLTQQKRKSSIFSLKYFRLSSIRALFALIHWFAIQISTKPHSSMSSYSQANGGLMTYALQHRPTLTSTSTSWETLQFLGVCTYFRELQWQENYFGCCITDTYSRLPRCHW